MPRKINKKSAPRRRPAKKQVRRQRKTRNVSEYASLSETRTMTTSGGFDANVLYNLMNTSLSQFTRAPLVAKAYQHYRIKYIQLKIKPTYDTFLTTNDPANVATKHHLYYMIDKAGAIPTNITLEGLKMMGAKPRALDEKTRVIGWRPSVLEVALTQGGAAPLNQGSKYTISPWLNTNASSVDVAVWAPSTIDHLGVYWYVEQGFGAASPYEVEVEVQFEFKKPLIATAVGQTHAVPALIAELNASKDGVVDSRAGGDDTQLTQ